MSEWQTIETAPKDGDIFLAWERGVSMAFWSVEFKKWSDCAEQHFYGDDSEFKPTHWMPLPKPPGGAPPAIDTGLTLRGKRLLVESDGDKVE